MTKVLITGGAGFIGSHLADLLLQSGYEVRVLDSLAQTPTSSNPQVELIVGDVRDAAAVNKALDGMDLVVHFAAAVGVGQSMYQPQHYTSVNCIGTSVLMEAVPDHNISKLLVASSMSIYGEGLCGSTPENKTPEPASPYALSKYYQEKLCLTLGKAYNIPTIALRFFNAYGSRQSLANPYTGVLAIFAARCLSGKPAIIFEDGQQLRDFVHVSDIARCCQLALESPLQDQVINVGSGEPISILQVAKELYALLGRSDLAPQITNMHRAGDIRNCYADITKAKQLLNYMPQMSFKDGLVELVTWLKQQQPVPSNLDIAKDELLAKGLLV